MPLTGQLAGMMANDTSPSRYRSVEVSTSEMVASNTQPMRLGADQALKARPAATFPAL
jgi:hypothetical protein